MSTKPQRITSQMAVIFMRSVVRISGLCLLQTYDELWLFISDMNYDGLSFEQCFMNEATGSTMVTESQNTHSYYQVNQHDLLKDCTMRKNTILSTHS
jgi:hypothetical protein